MSTQAAGRYQPRAAFLTHNGRDGQLVPGPFPIPNATLPPAGPGPLCCVSPDPRQAQRPLRAIFGNELNAPEFSGKDKMLNKVFRRLKISIDLFSVFMGLFCFV